MCVIVRIAQLHDQCDGLGLLIRSVLNISAGVDVDRWVQVYCRDSGCIGQVVCGLEHPSASLLPIQIRVSMSVASGRFSKWLAPERSESCDEGRKRIRECELNSLRRSVKPCWFPYAQLTARDQLVNLTWWIKRRVNEKPPFVGFLVRQLHHAW
jgi:hypothetical protein